MCPAQHLTVLNIIRKIAPLRVIARTKHGLSPKNIRVVLQICVHLIANINELRVELIVLRIFRALQILVRHDAPSELIFFYFSPREEKYAAEKPSAKVAAETAITTPDGMPGKIVTIEPATSPRIRQYV